MDLGLLERKLNNFFRVAHLQCDLVLFGFHMVNVGLRAYIWDRKPREDKVNREVRMSFSNDRINFHGFPLPFKR